MKKIKLIMVLVILILIFIVSLFMFRSNQTQDNDVYFYDGRIDKYSFQIVRINDTILHLIKVYTIEEGIEHEKLIPFDYEPKELENIYLEANIYEKVLGRNVAKNALYITQDPKLSNITNRDSFIAVLDIVKVTGAAEYGVFKMLTKAAYTYDDNSSKLAEFIDCRYANSKIGIILLKLGEENKIYSEGECVVLEAKNGKDLRKVSTKLVYHLLGVF